MHFTRVAGENFRLFPSFHLDARPGLNLLLGAQFPGMAFFISPLATALAWAPTNWILYSQAVRRARREATS